MNFMFSQRGDSKVITFFLVVAIIVGGISVWKMGVPAFKHVIFKDFARKQVNYNRENKIVSATLMRIIHDKVYNRAIELKLPVKENKLIVDRESDRVILTVNYSVPVDLFVYKFNMNFHFRLESEGIGFR